MIHLRVRAPGRCQQALVLGILIAVIIVAVVTATNDYSKQLQFRELSKQSTAANDLRVVRGGVEVAIKAEQIVCGDLVLVDTGSKLPADGLLLRGSDFKTNESA